MKSNTVNARLGLSGVYQLKATSDDGSERHVAGPFLNLITNSGLDGLSDVSPLTLLQKAFVSSDNAAPQVTDSQINNLVGSSATRTTESGINTAGRYVFLRGEWVFAQGAAAGNISKVAVGRDDNPFSISLIKDNEGNPITRTIQQNEFLTLSYELRISQPVDDIFSSLDGRDIILRPSFINEASYWGFRSMQVGSANSSVNGSWASGSDLQNIESFPAYFQNNRSTSATNDAYIPGSFTRTGIAFFGIDRANILIKTFAFTFGPSFWQFSVDPPIDKKNTDELSVGLRLTWGREGELPS